MTHVDYLRSQGFPEFVNGELYFRPVPPKCAACGGTLVGDEIRWGTCGHDGGRSVDPERSRRGGEGLNASPSAPGPES